MKKIKIALIGACEYNHTSQVIDSIKKLSDIFDFAGYCMPEGEKEVYPQITKLMEGYNEMSLEDILNNNEIEAVLVQTEETYTAKYVKLAAEHGKHIHMEKAGGIKKDEFNEAVMAAKRSGKVFHVGYMYRYNPCIIKLLEDIKSGELGDIISVEAQMNCIHPKEARMWLKRLPGGMMYYLGCHLVDLVLKIQGEPLCVVPFNCSTGADGVDSVDYGMAVFKYKNGASLIKTSAMERGGFLRRQLVVTGTKKTVELKPLEKYAKGNKGVFTGVTEYDSTGWHVEGNSYNSELFERYDGMIKAFGEMVLGIRENPNSYDYEIMLHNYILKACGSED